MQLVCLGAEALVLIERNCCRHRLFFQSYHKRQVGKSQGLPKRHEEKRPQHISKITLITIVSNFQYIFNYCPYKFDQHFPAGTVHCKCGTQAYIRNFSNQKRSHIQAYSS